MCLYNYVYVCAHVCATIMSMSFTLKLAYELFKSFYPREKALSMIEDSLLTNNIKYAYNVMCHAFRALVS